MWIYRWIPRFSCMDEWLPCWGDPAKMIALCEERRVVKKADSWITFSSKVGSWHMRRGVGCSHYDDSLWMLHSTSHEQGVQIHLWRCHVVTWMFLHVSDRCTQEWTAMDLLWCLWRYRGASSFHLIRSLLDHHIFVSHTLIQQQLQNVWWLDENSLGWWWSFMYYCLDWNGDLKAQKDVTWN